MKVALLMVLAAFATACGGGGKSESELPTAHFQTRPEVWMCPTHVDRSGTVFAGFTSEFKALFSNPEAWAAERAEITTFKLYLYPMLMEPGYVRDTIVPCLNEWGINMAIESEGGTLTHCRPELRVIEATFIDDLLSWGAPLTTLVMDSGLAAWLSDCPYDFEANLADVTSYVVDCRARWPSLRLGTTEPITSRFEHAIAPDCFTTLDRLVASLSSRGVALDFLQADNPYGWGQMSNVRSVEQHARSLGLDFSLIVNAVDSAKGTEQFTKGCVNACRSYAGLGGMPSSIVVQSWFPFPDVDIGPSSFTTALHAVLDELR